MPDTENGLLKGFDLDRLRAKIRTEPFSSDFERLRVKVKEAASRDRESDVIQPGGWCHSLYFTPLVLEAGFVYAMTGDPFAVEHVARQIDKLARVYAEPPGSFFREIPGLTGKANPSAYFSNAHTCLAARMCGRGLDAEHVRRIRELARDRLIGDHADPYFFTHFNAGHNAVVTHMIAAAICALVYGEESGHPETARVIELGRDACEMHLQWGFDEAGSPYEGPMYALVTVHWVYLFADLLKRHGGENLFESLPKLAVIPQAVAEMQLPGTRGLSGFQDCRTLIVQEPMPWLALTARTYSRPQDLALWELSQSQPDARQPHQAFRPGMRGVLDLLWWEGDRAEAPVLPTAFFGMGTAVAVLRSSWKADAVCLTALGQGRSHNVPDHTHGDAGHFSLFAYGEHLAYDTAYFNFDEDVHSVVLIDGTPHHRTERGNLYQGRFTHAGRHDLLDFVTVDAASAKGCLWAERHLLFIRGEGDFAYMVSLDNINRDNGVHAFTWQLQAAPGCRVETDGGSAVVRGERARLECHFVNPLPGDYPGCPHRLRLYANAQPHRDPLTGNATTHPRLAAEQTGPNCTLMALVIPRREGEEAVRVIQASGPRTLNVYVEHGAWVDQVVFACDHSWVRLPDLQASSEAVVVRRTRSGTVASVWTLDGQPARATSA